MKKYICFILLSFLIVAFCGTFSSVYSEKAPENDFDFLTFLFNRVDSIWDECNPAIEPRPCWDVQNKKHFSTNTDQVIEYAEIINDTGQTVQLCLRAKNKQHIVEDCSVFIPPNDIQTPVWYLRFVMNLDLHSKDGPIDGTWSITWTAGDKVIHVNEFNVGNAL